MSLKRIFKKRVAVFLIENGAELIKKKSGEVTERPDVITYFFKKDERFFNALDMYHATK